MAKKCLYQEFKEFAVKGNMMELAIGIIIGTAFTRIVNSLVQAVILPAMGMVVGNFDFKHLKVVLKEAEVDAAGKIIKEAVVVRYGEFIQAAVDFILIAVIIFAFIKIINSWKNKAEDTSNKEVPTPKDIQLLSEIRDLLKEKK